MGTVYLDIYIMKNFCIDYFLLHLVGSTMQLEKKRRYLLCASLIGTVGAVFPVLMLEKYGGIPSAVSLLLWYVIGLSMVKIAFSLKMPMQIWNAFMVLLIFSFLLNGVVVWLEQHWSLSAPLIFFLAFFILDGIYRGIFCRNSKRERIYPVTVHVKGQCIQAKALLDTGNELQDPLTGLPVMVGEFGAFSSCLPIEYKKLFENFYEREVPDYQKMAENGWKDIRWIPYETIGHKKELMIGILCNKIQIQTKTRTAEGGKAVLALVNQKFSQESEYTIILHNSMLH